ncbi:hypothetical protein [Actinomycetospora aeridis]|uniref:Uncharacterized protein n=1 Tax=Actinomycetospora aeridis TaxID=3129231 RepID=A0ABU8N674_9PSEU
MPAPRTPPPTAGAPAPPFVPPTYPPHYPPYQEPPAPEPRRSSRLLIALACVLALVAVALGAFLVVGTPWSSGAAPEVAATPGGAPPAGTAPAAGTVPALPALPADPDQALQTLRQSDAGAADALVGTWAPQLSAKKTGMTVDGRTYDSAAVLSDHQQLRGTHPDAVLVWSGDWTSFRGRDFWITLVNRSFPTGEAANAWCAQAGIGPDDCYAKRLSRTGGYAENTAMRTGAGSGSGGGTTSAAGTPTLGGPAPAGMRGFGEVRPSEVNANGDPTSYAENITWESWGGPQAIGRGTAGWYGPDQYASDTVLIPAVVVAYDLGECNGRPAYRSVGWYFPSRGETSLPPENGYRDICDGP